ncbi:MAG: hypothetical protein LBR38_06010 [Synergistaceae bacterium]|nr:hypothetical protein [Synergistaceae bacterium]
MEERKEQAATFESVWKMFQETNAEIRALAQQSARTDAAIAEASASVKEASASIDKVGAEMRAQSAATDERIAKEWAETRAVFKEAGVVAREASAAAREASAAAREASASVKEASASIDKVGADMRAHSAATDARIAKHAEATDARIAKHAEETDARIEERSAKLDAKIADVFDQLAQLQQTVAEASRIAAETSKTVAETSRIVAETSKTVAEVSQQIGFVTRSAGNNAESQVLPCLEKRFATEGYEVRHQRFKYVDDKKQTVAEVDWLLEKDDAVLLTEVKTTLKAKDVRDHKQRIAAAKAHPGVGQRGKKFFGAVAGITVNDDARNLALRSGFYLVEPSGDAMVVQDPPNGPIAQ